jgi:hypothetical protein
VAAEIRRLSQEAKESGKAWRGVMDAMELDVEGMTRQMSQATVGNRVVAPTNKGAKGKGAKTAQRTCLSGQAADGGEAGHSFGASAEGMIGSKWVPHLLHQCSLVYTLSHTIERLMALTGGPHSLPQGGDRIPS